MKINKLFLLGSITASIVAGTLISSCNKKFDEPAAFTDPNIPASTTIKQLKTLHTAGGFERITGDSVISGIVVADDRSGNLYKELYIQDATGGLAIELDRASLFGDYPIGRKIYIKCKDLYLSDYGGMVQLGMLDRSVPNNPTLTGIPATLLDAYIVKGSSGNPVTPTVVSSLSQLGTGLLDPNLGTLIQLNGFEIGRGDTSKTFADTSAFKKSVNITIQDCGGANSIIVRSSGFANFAGTKVPRGNGSITAVYTVFNGTKQLLIRDTSDMKFTGSRCNIFEEDFGTIVNNAVLDLAGWKNIGEVGGVKYSGRTFGSTGKVGYISAFGTGQATVTSWLISPPISVTGSGSTPTFSFTTSENFDNGATLKVFVSTDYNGSATPSTATWTQMPATIASGFTGSTFSPFVNSGAISLAAYVGKTIYIGFRYDGADPAGGTKKTTNFELDDIKVPKF